MRAVHIQSNVESLTLLGEQQKAAVLERVRPQTLTTIRDARRTTWLPLEVDVELTAAIDEVGGPDAVRAWSKQALAVSLDKPLLRGLLAALRVLGMTPQGVSRLAPPGWDAIYRNCGKIHREVISDLEIHLIQERAPALMMANPFYVDGIAGAFDVAVDICGIEGRCDVVEVDAEAERIVYGYRFAASSSDA